MGQGGGGAVDALLAPAHNAIASARADGTWVEPEPFVMRPPPEDIDDDILDIVDAAGPGPDVEGDPILLEWALESLVNNAIDALKGRDGTIILKVDSRERKAVLKVIDDGPGVPKETRGGIFQPGTSTKEGGWGIGLALARRVVEDNHGGKLVLEPTEVGATFALTLPIKQGKA